MLADSAGRPEHDSNDRYCLVQTLALADLNDWLWAESGHGWHMADTWRRG